MTRAPSCVWGTHLCFNHCSTLPFPFSSFISSSPVLLHSLPSSITVWNVFLRCLSFPWRKYTVWSARWSLRRSYWWAGCALCVLLTHVTQDIVHMDTVVPVFPVLGLSGWTNTYNCTTPCQAQQTAVQGSLAGRKGELHVQNKETFYMYIGCCSIETQISTLADHNEELMKLKHAGPWSKWNTQWEYVWMNPPSLYYVQ